MVLTGLFTRGNDVLIADKDDIAVGFRCDDVFVILQRQGKEMCIRDRYKSLEQAYKFANGERFRHEENGQ